ncbi:MAG: hypothetical protein HN904_21105 [Victivallales bacterium]|nr:hypothetical protein [Victivallales bacterium]
MKTKRSESHARRFLRDAVVLSVLFLIAHLLGLRQYTSVLSGTASFGSLQRLGGVVYLALYSLFVVCVPVLVIAAGLARTLTIMKRPAAHAARLEDSQPDDSAEPQPEAACGSSTDRPSAEPSSDPTRAGSRH